MKNLAKTILCAISLFLCVPAAAETLEYSGRVYAERVAQLLPLGSGTGILTMHAVGLVAMSGDPPSIFSLICSGLGIQNPEDVTTTEVYCNLAEDAANSFDLHGNFKDGAGEVKVIGGNGRFAGATGSGKFKRNEPGSDQEGTGVLQVTIKTK